MTQLNATVIKNMVDIMNLDAVLTNLGFVNLDKISEEDKLDILKTIINNEEHKCKCGGECDMTTKMNAIPGEPNTTLSGFEKIAPQVISGKFFFNVEELVKLKDYFYKDIKDVRNASAAQLELWILRFQVSAVIKATYLEEFKGKRYTYKEKLEHIFIRLMEHAHVTSFRD